MSGHLESFDDGGELAAALADAVADNLTEGIVARGAASLAVSGGSTPKRFFQMLGAKADLDWSKIFVTLVDERYVPETSPRSNAALVKAELLRGSASTATFVPLFAGGDAPTETRLETVAGALAAMPMPFDAVVLGMGADGHTASFFPNAQGLGAALTGEGPLAIVRAEAAGEPRVTLTLPALLKTRNLYLHIEGKRKKLVLDEAALDGAIEAMPVRAVLRQSLCPLQIYWAP